MLESSGLLAGFVWFRERQFHVRVAKVDYNRTEYYAVDETPLSQLAELLDHGVVIEDCRQPQFCVTTPASARATFFGLQRLFDTVDRDSSGSPGLSTLMLDPDYLLCEMAPRLFSAIASSRSLRKVWVGAGAGLGAAERPPPLTRHTMQWLGIALFSRLAHHKIEHVEFDLELDDYDAFKSMVDTSRARDPLVVVFDQQATSIGRHQHLRATASHFALLDPTAGSEASVIVHTQEHTGLRIIDHGNDWWSVLLPAWGRAWVPDRDITVTTTSEGPVSALATTFPLRREFRFQRVTADQLDTIVDALEAFQLRRARDLVQMHTRSNSATSPLTDRFVDALSDATHPIYQCVESLVVVAPFANLRDTGNLGVQLVGLLDRNSRLVSLDVWARPYRSTGWEDTVMAHHGATLVPRPLEVRQKLAFLSVLSGSKSDETVTRQLDSAVVAGIFEFAATHLVRNMCVYPEFPPYV